MQYDLFDRVDWDKVEGSSRRFQPLEEEMQSDMQREALYHKYHSKLPATAPEDDA